MGLRWEISVGGVFFGTGVTRALSHVVGRELVLVVILIRCVTTGASSMPQYLSAQYGTPSRPGEEKKVHVRYLISWWVSCCLWRDLTMRTKSERKTVTYRTKETRRMNGDTTTTGGCKPRVKSLIPLPRSTTHSNANSSDITYIITHDHAIIFRRLCIGLLTSLFNATWH